MKGIDVKPLCVAAECFPPYFMERKVKTCYFLITKNLSLQT